LENNKGFLSHNIEFLNMEVYIFMSDNNKQKSRINDLKREITGIIFLAFSLISFASLFNAAGPAGDFLDSLFSTLFGAGAYIIPVLIAYSGVLLISKEAARPTFQQKLGLAFIILLFLILIHIDYIEPGLKFHENIQTGIQQAGGGVIGALLAIIIQSIFGSVGTQIILITMGFIGFLLVTSFSVTAVFAFLGRIIITPIKAIRNKMGKIKRKKNVKDSRAASTKKKKNNTSKPHDTLVINEEINPELEDIDSFDTQDDNYRGKYKLPPLKLLQNGQNEHSPASRADINKNIEILEDTLNNFGLKGQVIEVNRGPTITRYELEPAPGVKVSKIVNLSNDLALALAAESVRIEAPVPGKAVVGIEVPNKKSSFVKLKHILSTRKFIESSSKLTITLGKDIAGKPKITNLNEMPHLLIAGATGSGKSVYINTLIISILYKARPSEVKFLMIDPKRVELSDYDGIPHLITPVITNPKEASQALKWMVVEMEKRYESFAEMGVRDIRAYNKQVALNQGKNNDDEQKMEPMPYMVVLIDELSDLMMVAPSAVEDAVCRLAQMARAAGIHLVIATQRPSVDVITGIIKANIPSRISFAVSSQTDSRTIIDVGGAEKLLGNGDMLYAPVSAGKPIRIQGSFISDSEVKKVVSFLKKQQSPDYCDDVFNDNIETNLENADNKDELYDTAVKLVVERGQASISKLQRKLRIGYNRAARLVDQMEEEGIVGGYRGTKPREVLISENDLIKDQSTD